MISPRLGDAAADPKSAFEHSCKEFTEFFKRRKMQALKTLPATSGEQNRLRAHRYRSTTFQDGTPIFTALNRMDTGYESPDKRQAVEHCRMACLVYLNLVMDELGDLSEATENYLKTLRGIVDDSDDDSSLTAEHLLWTLLATFDEPDHGHYERIWKTCRLVGLIKRSAPQTLSRLENTLRVYLQIPEDIKRLEDVPRDFIWGHGNVLMEVDSRPGFVGS